jgi:hypothetical protein
MPKLRVLSGREVLRRGSGLCSVGAVTKMREAQGSGLCVIPCLNMKKTMNRSAKESHSVNTSCSVLNVPVSVFAETTPSFLASRVLSTART